MNYLPLLMFATLFLAILSGYPVAFCLGGVALLFAFLGHALDLFYLTDLGFVPGRIFGIVTNITLMAVPLFVFMGVVLEQTGVAEHLLRTGSILMRRFKGSLAMAVVVIGAVLAASTGIVGATVVTMGVLSLPAMLEQKYDKEVATGTIAAAGTLGQIIPPSIVLVILGDMMNVDVGDLFVGAIIPGALLVSLYLVWLFVLFRMHPHKAGTVQKDQDTNLDGKKILASFVPPVLLVVTVLGSILGGLASPTEAAACGAVGSLVIGLAKRKLTWNIVKDVGIRTASISAMVFMILIGAQFFGVVFRGLGGDDLIIDSLSGALQHPGFMLFAIMMVLFVLGFFLDFLEICFIVIPIAYPIFLKLNYDPLWLSILIAMNLQTSFLTPPFGFSLFYLKGVAPAEVRTEDIYRGVIPYVAIQLVVLVLIAMFPALVTWLPALMN